MFRTIRQPRPWRLPILLIGFGTLGAVVGKISDVADPVEDRRVADEIAKAVAAKGDAAGHGTSHGPKAGMGGTWQALLPEPLVEGMPAADEGLMPFGFESDELGRASAKTPAPREVTVRAGDSLSTIFDRLGLGYGPVHRIMALGEPTEVLARLRPGDQLRYWLDDNDTLRELEYSLSATRSLRVVRDSDGAFNAEVIERETTAELAYAEGEIRHSLYASAVAAGISPRLIMQLAEILGSRIDFVHEIREGDRFALLYETRLVNGEPVGSGDILMASFINRGREVAAVRFDDGDGSPGYFTPEGENLQGSFLRYPLEFTRVSSPFSLARKHPIHGVVRPHLGVDLAAPTGTPVRAAGDGRVSFVGWQGGYGKVVFIDHDGGKTTVYAHLSRFSEGLASGSRVEKGQVIGRVGMTGDATGPHLHYEFRVNGRHKDPLTVDLPGGEPLAGEQLAAFRAELAQYRRQVANLQADARLARTDPSPDLQS